MSQLSGVKWTGSPYLIVALWAALVASIGQITLGGVVRVTGSGLGCPDWPLCHGRLFPPLESTALIEYSHRLSASALALLVIAATVLAWRSHIKDRKVVYSTSAALTLVVVAAVLGGITVQTELAWWVVLLHLGTAEAIVACLVIAIVVTGPLPTKTIPYAGSQWLRVLALTTLPTTFFVILLGSYMTGVGYGSSCSTWPLCHGSILQDGSAYTINMAHRLSAGILGLLIIATATSAWGRRAILPHVWLASLAAVALIITQSLVGAATVWTGFSAHFKAFHVTIATLLWTAVAFVAAVEIVYGRLRVGAEAKHDEARSYQESSTT